MTTLPEPGTAQFDYPILDALADVAEGATQAEIRRALGEIDHLRAVVAVRGSAATTNSGTPN